LNFKGGGVILLGIFFVVYALFFVIIGFFVAVFGFFLSMCLLMILSNWYFNRNLR